MAPLTPVLPAVVVVGDLMVDVLAAMSGPLARDSDTPARITTVGGGSGANVAAWLAAEGITTSYVGRTGPDVLGEVAVRTLDDTGVDSWVGTDEVAATGACVVLVAPDGERSMLPDAGANATLRPEHVPDALFRPGAHLHLSGYTLLNAGSRAAGQHALALAVARRMTVSVDPSSAALLAALGAEAFLAMTRGVGLLLPNRDEATALTGIDDPVRAAAALADAYPEVVVKLGADGARWQQGFITASAPAVGSVDVVDTTGAGDAFAAGFLSSWLRHPEPEAALAAGNRLAARAVGRVGARP